MVNNRNNNKKAFTLVELLIVIIIIAVLAAIAIPKFANSSLRSKESSLKAELALLRSAVELFKNDCGSYPSQLSDLAAGAAPATGTDSAGSSKAITAADWKGPYVSKISADPVDAGAFTYSTTAGTVGKITAHATGNSTDGTAYSTW